MQPTSQRNNRPSDATATPLPNLVRSRSLSSFCADAITSTLFRNRTTRSCRIEQKKFLFFFTFSRLICAAPDISWFTAPPDTLKQDFNVSFGRRCQRGRSDCSGRDRHRRPGFRRQVHLQLCQAASRRCFRFSDQSHSGNSRMIPRPAQPFYIKRLAGLPGDTLRIDPPLSLCQRRSGGWIWFSPGDGGKGWVSRLRSWARLSV